MAFTHLWDSATNLYTTLGHAGFLFMTRSCYFLLKYAAHDTGSFTQGILTFILFYSCI